MIDNCKTIEVHYQEKALSHSVGMCYSLKDAQDYKEKNGGIIFKEKDMEVYRIFPDGNKEFPNNNYSMEAE